MKTIEIVGIKETEVEKLQAISIETYQATFGEHNSEELMTTYLDEAYALDKLRRELQEEQSEFYWAVLDDRIAGYLKLNIGQAQTEAMGEGFLEIERIYVRSPFKSKGIGSIAAGEVVERPASVVKELVENSIDALAHRIDIYIEDGGLQMIKVVDNGEGMSKEDARLCFSRHATSKIKDDQDLFNIMTLGFRGEAIPSIASVSHFDLRTSTGEAGYFMIYEFGKSLQEGICDLPKGTQITITKIFQNVPARLKYLKSVNSEFAAIHQYVERIALAYPHIAIRLYHNEKLIFQTNGKGN